MYRRPLVAVMIGAASLLAAPIHAQTGLGLSMGTSVEAPEAGLSLRTLDEDRLFRASEFGQRVIAEIEAASRTLEAENDRLLAELTARESELTELRSEMTVEEFRAEAADFDLQAETIRRRQAEKRQRLVDFEEGERRRFFGDIGPVLQDLLRRTGGQMIVDARAVVIAAPGIDITDEAVTAIDDAIGDGAPPPEPLDMVNDDFQLDLP